MKQQLLQLALREVQSLMADRRLWIAFSVVVALFVVTGPFGTYDLLGFTERLGFWLTVHAVTWVIALAGIALVSVWSSKDKPITVAQTVLGCCLATPLIGLAVSLVKALFLASPFSTEVVLWQMLQALPVAIIVGLVAYYFFQSAPGEALASPVAAGTSSSRLIMRLPPEKRGVLQHLSMQDHYVEVVTDKGRELVLLRLADAIAEAGEDQGIQVHRSHWVAFDAVRSVEREAGKAFIVTKAGVRLPVSRTFMPALKQARFAVAK